MFMDVFLFVHGFELEVLFIYLFIYLFNIFYSFLNYLYHALCLRFEVLYRFVFVNLRLNDV